MIYVCGDVHGRYDIQKLYDFANGKGKNLTKADYLIVAGDFGILWDQEETQKERELKKTHDSFPWTTLFVDGNHENHARLDELPVEYKFGYSPIGRVSSSIYHLKRGYLYSIPSVLSGGTDILSVFTFGGGYSIDKAWRDPGISWWERELPSDEEYARGRKTLEHCGNKVDVVITHTAPRRIFMEMKNELMLANKNAEPELYLQDYFQQIAMENQFSRWIFGHFHYDWTSSKDPRFSCHYKGEPILLAY